jgi:hypothetical protein
MHIFFPRVGIDANVSPIEQHVSRATVQFAWENLFVVNNYGYG